MKKHMNYRNIYNNIVKNGTICDIILSKCLKGYTFRIYQIAAKDVFNWVTYKNMGKNQYLKRCEK